MRHLKALGAAIAIGPFAAYSAQAETYWSTPESGLWQDAGNWDNGAPQSGSSVSIINGDTKTVTIDNSTPLENLDIAAIRLSGAGNTLVLSNSESTLSAHGIGDPAYRSAVVVSQSATLHVNGGNLNISGPGFAYLSVDDAGVLQISSGHVAAQAGLLVGGASGSARLLMTGGILDITSGQTYIAAFANTRAEVDISGGIFRTSSIDMGSGSGTGGASIDVHGNGILETSSIYYNQSYDPGAIPTSLTIRDGGTLQFTSSAFYVGSSSPGAALTVNNGVISYRNVSDADISKATLSSNFTFSGNNAFRLNSSSNQSIASYTFDSGLGGENYTALELTGSNSAWRTTGTTTIGSNGRLTAFDAENATVDAALVNSGLIEATHSTILFKNTVNITATGALRGTSSELQFQEDLFIQTTNAVDSNFTDTTFRLSTGADGDHIVNITSSAFLESGRAGGVSNPFTLGALTISHGNKLILTGEEGVNALYVNLLTLEGLDLSAEELATSLISALDLSGGLNIYYNATLAENAFLNGLDYDLWGGQGQLLAAIPEPTSVGLLLLGSGLFFVKRKRKTA